MSNRSTRMDLTGAALMGPAAAIVRANALAITLTVKLITPDLKGAERTSA